MAGGRAVIFDLDGLVFDVEDACVACWERQLARYGRTVPPGMVAALRGATSRSAPAILRRHLGNDVAAVQLWRGHLQALVDHLLTYGAPLREGVVDLATYLHDCQIPAAVCSPWPTPKVEAILAKSGVGAHFPVVVGSGGAGRPRSREAALVEAADLLGSARRSTVVLEDNERGVDVARQAGFRTVRCTSRGHSTDASGADALVFEVGEVIDLIESGVLLKG